MQPLTYEPGDCHSLDVERITVDGRQVDLVVYACPRRGIVDAFQHEPGDTSQVRLCKRGKRVLTKRYRGAVRVVFKDDTVDAGGGRGHH